jgi:glycosyltransferase involved in cell wall biosynthesis
MKILHLLYESEGDYFGIGGAGIRAYEIYRFLKGRHDITLLCKKYPGARDRDIEGLKHIFVGAESVSLAKTLLSYAFHSGRFVHRHGDEFDVIIEEFSPAVPTFLHCFSKRPIVLQIQGYTGRLYFRKYNPFSALALYTLESVRPLFYKSLIFICDETRKRFSLKNRRCIGIIPNGVSSKLLNVSPDEGDYVLYLGRIDIYGKGLDLLLSAYQKFTGSSPGVKLAIAGDGRDAGRFKGMINRVPDDIRKGIKLLGWVSGDKKSDVLGRALFVLFPSRHEVQPISVLEAMACGKAVIVSDIPEFSFVTEHGAGLSFRSGDADSLAQSMVHLAGKHMHDMRGQMGRSGRDVLKDRTWDKIAEMYEGFLEQTVRRCSGACRGK